MKTCTHSCKLVQVLLEAEEETGSASLAGLLQKRSALLAADLAVSCDGGQLSDSQGGIPVSMRGRVSFDLDARTLSHDVHSGVSVQINPTGRKNCFIESTQTAF